MSNLYRVPPSHFEPLKYVATIRDIEQLYGYGYTKILYHIIEDHIAALQSVDNRWLVSLPSVAAFWGEPNCPIERFTPPNGAYTALQIKAKNHDNRGSAKTRRTLSMDAQVSRLQTGFSLRKDRRANVQQRLPTKVIQVKAGKGRKRPPRKVRTIRVRHPRYRMGRRKTNL